MLNPTKLLSYIKQNIGFPWQFIELSDTEILDYAKTYSLSTFSQYFPDTNTIGVSLRNPLNKVPGKANEYYITEPQGREIFNIVEVIFSGSNLYINGYPPLGPMSIGELSSWALSTEIAGWMKTFGNWNYTTVFKSPNIVSIRPTPTSEDWVSVEYERQHAEDFSTIGNSMQMYFCELALADIMILCGRARKKYGSGGLQSPFGTINLSDEIFEEGKEKRSEVIEKLTSGAIPNVIISFG